MEDTTLPDFTSIYTAGEFQRWLTNAKPGSRCEYHRGRLSEDRRKKDPGLDVLAFKVITSAGYERIRFRDDGTAWWVSTTTKPKVRLFQRRTGPREFAYLADKL
jgi:hypothetical protein